LSYNFAEQINEGLDRAIMTMKKGEQALVTVTRGYLHSNDISGMANEDLFYEVELIDFIKVLHSYISYSTSVWKRKWQSFVKH